MTGTNNHTVALEHGFIDDKQVTHKEIIFGHRINGYDLINVDKISDYMGRSFAKPLYLTAAITKFGELPQSKFLDALLSLDDLEFEQVTSAFDDFLNLQGVKPEPLNESSIKLAFGVEVAGVVYDTVTFGNPLLGWDLIKADKLKVSDVERAYYLVGLQVSKLATSDAQREASGPLSLESFYTMDAE